MPGLTVFFFYKKKDSARGFKFLRAHSFDFWNFWCFWKLNASSARWCIQIRYLSATIKTPLQQSKLTGPRVSSGGRKRNFQIIDSYGVRLCIACELSPNRFWTYPVHFLSIPSVFPCLNRWSQYLHQVLIDPGCGYAFKVTRQWYSQGGRPKVRLPPPWADEPDDGYGWSERSGASRRCLGMINSIWGHSSVISHPYGAPEVWFWDNPMANPTDPYVKIIVWYL